MWGWRDWPHVQQREQPGMNATSLPLNPSGHFFFPPVIRPYLHREDNNTVCDRGWRWEAGTTLSTHQQPPGPRRFLRASGITPTHSPV